MLVWLRDFQYTVNRVNAPTFNRRARARRGSSCSSTRTTGRCGGPARRRRRTAPGRGTTSSPARSRRRSRSTRGAPRVSVPGVHRDARPPVPACFCTSFGAQRAEVPEFTDALGWYPGLEITPAGGVRFADQDASVVVPSRGQPALHDAPSDRHRRQPAAGPVRRSTCSGMARSSSARATRTRTGSSAPERCRAGRRFQDQPRGEGQLVRHDLGHAAPVTRLAKGSKRREGPAERASLFLVPAPGQHPFQV